MSDLYMGVVIEESLEDWRILKQMLEKQENG